MRQKQPFYQLRLVPALLKNQNIFLSRAAAFRGTKRIVSSTTYSRQHHDPPWPRPRLHSQATAMACPCPGCTRGTSTVTSSWTPTTATVRMQSSTWSPQLRKQTSFCRSSTKRRRGNTKRQFLRLIGQTRLRWWIDRITRNIMLK